MEGFQNASTMSVCCYEVLPDSQIPKVSRGVELTYVGVRVEIRPQIVRMPIVNDSPPNNWTQWGIVDLYYTPLSSLM